MTHPEPATPASRAFLLFQLTLLAVAAAVNAANLLGTPDGPTPLRLVCSAFPFVLLVMWMVRLYLKRPLNVLPVLLIGLAVLSLSALAVALAEGEGLPPFKLILLLFNLVALGLGVLIARQPAQP
ncbi:hypothetical protein [Deinococcus radiotolerans]|uniref:Uncharacterized protein n=1 Tax=Deinococcus radiotolerans TaxID=1309407 RepID=A0ABQ2FFL3_9DEIO|nr:hypothetical protein [Deinococcus radiotolerans]GGK93638.1 hypothetical protein GCM10010844_10150 [Deinococcus radiotolerans]